MDRRGRRWSLLHQIERLERELRAEREAGKILEQGIRECGAAWEDRPRILEKAQKAREIRS